MAANERANVQVSVNNDEAKAALEEIQSELKSIKQLRKEAFEKGDTTAFEMYDKEFKKVGREAAKMKREMEGVESVMKNLNGASVNQLNDALRRTTREMQGISRSDPRFGQLQAQARTLRAELNSVNAELREQQSFLQRATDKFNNYFGVAAAGIAAVAGMGMTVQKAIDKANAREDTMGKVKALTDLGKAELAFLEQQAIQTATMVQTVGGQDIRIQKTTDEILEAYQLVGSQKPELLANKEALHSVTNEIMIMAEASEGLDLRSAIGATTTAMNQYGASAQEASRFTNAMAAGAQVGAVEIPEIGEAIKDFGVNAKKANVSIEGSVALIEVIGEKAGLYGPRAGTQMRNFFSILSAGPKETNPEVVGLATAMENLAAKNMSSAEWVKMFGRENANTAQILVQNRGYWQEMTTAIEGNNAAYKQAADNTADTNARLTQAKTKASEYAIEIGQKLAPAYIHIISSGKLLLMTISAIIDLFKNHGTEILLVAGAITAYTVAMKLQNAESKMSIALTKTKAIASAAWGSVVSVLTGQVTVATIAQKLWNAVIMRNPIGAIIAAVALFAAGVVWLVKSLNSQSAAQKAVNEVTEEAMRETQKQKNIVNDLLAVAKDETKSLEERQAALAKLNEISPEYFGNLSIEKSSTEQLTAAGEAYIKNLEKQALVKAAQAKIDKLMEENANKEVDNQTRKSKWYQTEERAIKKRTKAINENKEAITELRKIVDSNTDSVAPVAATPTPEPEAPQSTGTSGEDAKKKAREKAFKDLENWNQKELNAIRKQQVDKTVTEQEAQQKQQDLKMDFLNKRMQLEKKFGESTLKTEGEILDETLKARQEFEKAETERKKKELDKASKDLDTELTKELNGIKQQLADKAITEQEAEVLMLQKEVEFINKKIELRKQYGEEYADLEAQILDKSIKGAEAAAKADKKTADDLAALKKKYADEETQRQQDLNDELAELDRLTKNGALLSHEEYERMKASITEKYAKERFVKEREYAKAATDILNAGATIIENKKTAEMNKAEKDGQRKIELAGDDTKAKEKAEADLAKKKEQIEKKYAKKQQGIAIGQAFMSGAQAIMELWANKSTLPSPANEIYKGAMTAAILGTTATQIGVIKSQSFATGGFTQDGGKYEPAGIVHKGEFVANQEAVKNPSVLGMLNLIDVAQRNGTIGQLNLPAAMAAMYGAPMRQFAKGGFESAASNTATTLNIAQTTDPNLLAAIGQMVQASAQMVQAANALAAKDLNLSMSELKQRQTDYENLLQSTSIKKP